MRLVAGLLALTLTGTLAFADEANAPEPQPSQAERSRAKVGLRVVRVMTESQQALLFDKNRGTHVLADVGSVIGTYTVTAIDDDEVTLSSEGREVVLAAPESTWRGRRGASPASAAKKPPAADTAAVAPADPYADPAETVKSVATGQVGVRFATAPSSEPMTNPYDESTLDVANKPLTATEMEINPYNEPELALTESATDPYAEPRPAKRAPAEDPGVRAFVDAMDGEVIVNTAEQATRVSRKELDVALGDFAGLTASMRGAFTPAGTRIDVVAPGTVFAKAGLRNGDVITSVDGQPLTSIDDAAELYIRAGSARTAKVQLLRAGKPMTLRLAIQ